MQQLGRDQQRWAWTDNTIAAITIIIKFVYMTKTVIVFVYNRRSASRKVSTIALTLLHVFL